MGQRVRRLVAGWLIVAGAVVGGPLWSATPAAAHNSLTGSNPPDGARLAQAPASVELRFLARLDPATTTVTVTGPDDVPASRGTPTVTGSRVTVAFVPGPAGPYVVDYRVRSADGHPVTGTLRFTLTTGTPAEPSPTATTPSGAPSSTASPAAGSPEPPSTPAPGGTPSLAAESGADEDRMVLWLWGLGGVVLLAIAAAALLARRRSRPSGPA